MHYSKHTRTSCYSSSALPSQGQALSCGRGKSPFNPSSIWNGLYCCQYIELSILPDTATYLQFSKAEDSDVWKKKSSRDRWKQAHGIGGSEYTSAQCHGEASCGFQNLNQQTHVWVYMGTSLAGRLPDKYLLLQRYINNRKCWQKYCTWTKYILLPKAHSSTFQAIDKRLGKSYIATVLAEWS